MCKKADESIDHIVSGCRNLAQKEYKRSHNNLGKIVNCKLARKCNFEAGDKWYEHEPEYVLEVIVIFEASFILTLNISISIFQSLQITVVNFEGAVYCKKFFKR